MRSMNLSPDDHGWSKTLQVRVPAGASLVASDALRERAELRMIPCPLQLSHLHVEVHPSAVGAKDVRVYAASHASDNTPVWVQTVGAGFLSACLGIVCVQDVRDAPNLGGRCWPACSQAESRIRKPHVEFLRPSCSSSTCKGSSRAYLLTRTTTPWVAPIARRSISRLPCGVPGDPAPAP